MAGIDYTKLVKKLHPAKDGEGHTSLRTGVVDAINSDGTADVVISGVVVPDVPRLAKASIQIGAVVQILSYLGSLLIIGQSATTGASGGLGLWTRVRSVTASATMTTTLTTVLTTPTVTFIRNRVYEIKTRGGLAATSAGVADLRAFRSGGATLGEWFRTSLTVGNVVFDGNRSGIYFAVSNAGDVTGAVDLQMSVTVGNGQHFANASTERNLEVWDVGDSSQFPGIQTW